MNKMIHVLRLNNEIEAQIMTDALDNEDIPHRIRSFHDTVYDGLYQMEKGWGVLEAPEEFGPKILEIAEELLKND